MDSERFDVSVIMATYNPVWEKCVFTLDSIIGQIDVDLELIIVDDGSRETLFGKISEYLDRKGFTNYRLIDHKVNQGTVKNYRDGVAVAKGKYIKLISPGDAIFNQSTLSSWISFLDNSGRLWSFADAVYYLTEDNGIKICSLPTAPRIIDCYINDNTSICRWNYVVLEDLPLGAAILCDRLLFAEYLNCLIDSVVYSEDLSYMLMMYDGIIPAYYSTVCVFYEFGCGVSTTNNGIWRTRFQNDVKNAELLIVNKPNKDELQKKISDVLMLINSGGIGKKRILKNLQKGGLKKVFKYRFNPRLSSVDIFGCGEWWK